MQLERRDPWRRSLPSSYVPSGLLLHYLPSPLPIFLSPYTANHAKPKCNMLQLIIESRSHNLKKDLCYIVPLHCTYIINTPSHLPGRSKEQGKTQQALLRHSILRFNLKNELTLILTLTSNAYSAMKCGKSGGEATRWSLLIVYAVGRLLRKSTQSMFIGLPLTTKSQKFTAATEDRSTWKLQCFSPIGNVRVQKCIDCREFYVDPLSL